MVKILFFRIIASELISHLMSIFCPEETAAIACKEIDPVFKLLAQVLLELGHYNSILINT